MHTRSLAVPSDKLQAERVLESNALQAFPPGGTSVSWGSSGSSGCPAGGSGWLTCSWTMNRRSRGTRKAGRTRSSCNRAGFRGVGYGFVSPDEREGRFLGRC
jgi:hypothetical protein